MAVRGRQLPPVLRLVRPYFVRRFSARGIQNTSSFQHLMRLGWVAISNGKEGAGAHDPTPPACHIIHVRTSELNKVFTVGGATLAAERIQRSKPHSLTVITRPRKSVCNRHVHLPKNVREGDTNTASRITDAVSARSTI